MSADCSDRLLGGPPSAAAVSVLPAIFPGVHGSGRRQGMTQVASRRFGKRRGLGASRSARHMCHNCCLGPMTAVRSVSGRAWRATPDSEMGHFRPHALQKRLQEAGSPARCNPFPCAPDRDRLSLDQIGGRLMRRREFIAGLGGVAARQQAAIPTIGALSPTTLEDLVAFVDSHRIVGRLWIRQQKERGFSRNRRALMQ
jgi:hypothetical protein